MNQTHWHGVIPAITTPFNPDLSVNTPFIIDHAAWMVSCGCTAIVWPGSLGEGATLTRDEKARAWSACAAALGHATPVIAAISALATRDAVDLARLAADSGCRGLMVLPPYAYTGDWRETRAYFAAVFTASPLSCMLYNNPIAYAVDVRPEQLAELAQSHANLHAVKESSADIRRLAAIRALIGDRLALLVGVDDLIVEGVAMGAVGWIAGLVNAFPAESVALFNLARQGRMAEAFELYRWFLPLLRMDVVPEFVHLIKLVQQEVGRGSEQVRPPRLPLAGSSRETALATLRHAMATRPKLPD